MGKYIKPTLETKFYIDFTWWQQKGKNLPAFMRGHLCEACAGLAEEHEGQTFDWINPETGETYQIDQLWYLIHTHCPDQPGFLDSRVPLTTAIFRAFIATNNASLTPVEIHEKIGTKSPETILRTIGGRRIYNGIKPTGYQT